MVSKTINDFPKRIKYLFDENESVLIRQEETKTNKIKVGIYKYVKSETKLGQEYAVTLDEINRLLSYNVIEATNTGRLNAW